MRALLCRSFGPPEKLRLEDVDPPALGATGIRVAVHRAGLNFPDVLIVRGKYQVKPELPFSPGAEVSGVVMEVGARVTGFAPGDRVMALCTTGGFAEEAVVHEGSAFKMADAMTFDAAAALPLTYGTTIHALVDRANIAAGETLLVTGAGGGVGIAAVQLGKALGATVIAAAGSDEKRAAATEAGADYVIDYVTESLVDRVKAITKNTGVDVVYDAVGGDVFDAWLRAIGWGGRLLIVGFASGRIPDIPANRLLLKGASAMGVYWGSFAARDPAANARNFERLFALYAQKAIEPKIGHTYAFEDTAQAKPSRGCAIDSRDRMSVVARKTLASPSTRGEGAMNSAQLCVTIAAFALTVGPVSGLAARANAADVETIALTCPKGEIPHGTSCVKKTVRSTIPKITYVNGRQVVVPNKARTSHLPKGTYGKYCTDSTMQGKYLVSHCESTDNGGTFSTITSIDPSTCGGREIIAKAGLLQCAPAPSASKPPAS